MYIITRKVSRVRVSSLRLKIVSTVHFKNYFVRFYFLEKYDLYKGKFSTR